MRADRVGGDPREKMALAAVNSLVQELPLLIRRVAAWSHVEKGTWYKVFTAAGVERPSLRN